MFIRKNLNISDVSLKMDGETGTFSGYASVFGGVDSYGDTIAPGAFSETLSTHGVPKMFFNHQWDMPIGKWLSAIEDQKGLMVRGELTAGIQVADNVRAAMKHGTLDGLSIGGFLRKGDFEETKSGRTITKWSRLVEVSPVSFPADESARVDLSSVKSDVTDAIEEIETIRDFERFLRDAGGLSKAAACAVIARANAIFTAVGDPSAEAEQLAKLHSIALRVAGKSAG